MGKSASYRIYQDSKEMINWKLEKRLIKDLKEHPKNPRQLTKDQERNLRKSLDKFGLADKPIINTDGTIIGGHQRLRILKKELKEIECWVPERPLTDKEVDEMNIRLNRNLGEWDFDVLANEWEIPDLLDWGFNPDELSLGAEEIEGEEFEGSELLEPPKDPITKPGDLYELGPHRLLCGDSTMPDDVNKLLHDAEPILMVTDPPYGVNYDPRWRVNILGNQRGKNAVGKVSNDDCANWVLTYSLFPGSIAYVWHSGKFASEVANNLNDSEYEIISQVIWIKQHFALSRGDYHWQHEACWYAVKKGHSHNWQGSRKESTVWEISSLNCLGKSQEEDERTAHGTQKPLECMARPIRNNTAKGEGVYDPFLGSGTTLIAAEKLERICYGIEIDPAYCDIIVDRYRKFCAKQGKEAIIKKNGEILHPL